jgi:hypothetical protein
MTKFTKSESFLQDFFGIFGELCNKHSIFMKWRVLGFIRNWKGFKLKVLFIFVIKSVENPPHRQAAKLSNPQNHTTA